MAFAVQSGGARLHPGEANLIAPFILVAFVMCVGAVLVPALGLAISGSRGALRSWRGRRRRLRAAANAELRARAMMTEMCAHGWRAQITISAGAGERPGDAGDRSRVAVDWSELQDETGRPVVVRRVCAPTIGEALDAMVADRRTDETLERIERGAVAEGARWPDL